MHTSQSLLQQLEAMGIQKQDTLLVHASIKSVGAIQNGADALLDALEQAVCEGLLVLPTHTWSYINAENPTFDLKESPSCVGKLPEIFRHRAGVLRSKHPTHSVAAKGADAAAYIAGHEKSGTPVAWDSPWGRLCQRKAKVLLVGVDFSCNTLIHCVEEVMQIPGRIDTQPQALEVRDLDGTLIPVPSYRHRGADSNLYRKLEAPMLARGICRRMPLGDAQCLLCDVAPMFALTKSFLQREPNLLGDDTPVPQQWYR